MKTLGWACCFLLLFLNIGWARATNLHVVNNCGSRVCAEYWVPNEVGGGCKELEPGQSWDVGATARWIGGTLWGSSGGCGECNHGPPSGTSLFEITVAGGGNFDYYDVSLLAGFNIGIKAAPTNARCFTVDCQSPSNCPYGFVRNGHDMTKSCPSGSTDYNIIFCQ